MSGLTIELERVGTTLIAHLAGEIDLGNTAELLDRLEAATSANDDAFVTDLSDVGYIDSGGIRVLFKLARSLTEADRAFAVCVPEGSSLQKLLKVVRLEDVAPVFASLAAAVDAVAVRD